MRAPTRAYIGMEMADAGVGVDWVPYGVADVRADAGGRYVERGEDGPWQD